MAYSKQNFQSKQTLTAAHMNHIEDGIVAVNEDIDTLKRVTSYGSGTPTGFDDTTWLPSACTWYQTGKICHVKIFGRLGGLREYSISLPANAPEPNSAASCMAATINIVKSITLTSSEFSETMYSSSVFGTTVKFTPTSDPGSNSAAIIDMTYYCTNNT